MNYDSKEGEAKMRKIYTGIDLGSDSIKIVVASKKEDRFVVLATSSSKSQGIHKGQITNTKDAVASLKKCILETEDMLGVKLKKAIVCVPTENASITIATGEVNVEDQTSITGDDIGRVLKEAVTGKLSEEEELITAMPIHFKVGEELVKDPKKMKGDTLEIKTVIATLPKEPLYRLLEVVRLAGIETVDVAFQTTGDYFQVRNDRIDSEVGAIVNIGYEKTDVSIFNKGIMIKNATIPIGSRFVDKDISYVYKLEEETARKLKEEFATAVTRYADTNDVCEVSLEDGTSKEIEQPELSKVVESRVYEILKLVKKEVKALTNREISYIIITGGLSELAGFQYAVEDILERKARICNIKTMGVRHNKYSSVIGLLEYYDDKLKLRGKNESMFTSLDVDLLLKEKKQEVSNDHIVSKVFGHFFDN